MISLLLSFMFLPVNHLSVDSSGFYINSQQLCVDHSQTDILSFVEGDYVYSIDTLQFIRHGECGIFKDTVKIINEEYSFDNGNLVIVFVDHKISEVSCRGTMLGNGAFYGKKLDSLSEDGLFYSKEYIEHLESWLYRDRYENPVIAVGNSAGPKTVRLYLHPGLLCQ